MKLQPKRIAAWFMAAVMTLNAPAASAYAENGPEVAAPSAPEFATSFLK